MQSGTIANRGICELRSRDRTMLDDQQLRVAWQQYNKYAAEPKRYKEQYGPWWDAYVRFVSEVDKASVKELATAKWQERLWKDPSITPAGPGDFINVTALYEDAEVVDRIIALKTNAWPQDAAERASALQAKFNELLDLVATREVRVRPAAKLKRIFAAIVPHDCTCVLAYGANQNVAELLLLLKSHKRAHVELQVLMRQRLRNVLGPEDDGVELAIHRSTFCWWLHENYEELSETGEVRQPIGTSEHLERKEIVLWPFGKQYKSNAAVRGYDAYYRDIVQASVARVSRDDLVEILRSSEEYAHLQPQSVRLKVSMVKGLGFLQESDGLLFPTRAGEELLEAEQSDVLVHALLERVFGCAQLLRVLVGEPLHFDDVATALQAIYPNWTSKRAPKSLLTWSRVLGLVDQNSDRKWTLSAYGRDWADRLPKQLPTPTQTTEAEPTDDPVSPSSASFPAFSAIFSKIQQLPETAAFVFDRKQIAALDAGWRFSGKKRFVILSGLSGTGKTAVTRCYARAVCALMEIDIERHLAVVPVSPDWRDPTGMFGYFNALHADPTFQAEPALRLILRAADDSTRPYFLILDEMNLARVERYFAPMLSAMETGDRLALHANDEPVNGVPPSVAWPRNLYIGGTVNMDESTHALSDKVLDRAFTFEFWDVDLKAFFRRRADAGQKRDPALEAMLVEFYGLLRPIRRHFGYRTAGEVMDFVATLTASGEAGGAVDIAVFAKVLPRLRGEETKALSTALEELAKLCKAKTLPKCEAKLSSMLDQLRHTGVTKFWA